MNQVQAHILEGYHATICDYLFCNVDNKDNVDKKKKK